MLCLVRTRACRRCGGDLSLEYDTDGVYAECIQCGATWSKHDLVPPAPLKEATPPTDTRRTSAITGSRR